MPKIYPFKGWRYNLDIVNDLSKVVSPPYDVISEQDQKKLYDLSPYNFIRIILNNNPPSKRYADSAKTLSEWKTKKIIQQDDNEALYLLSQSFDHGKDQINRIGFISKLQISQLGAKILPHEQTISKHINDRYELMKSTQANTGQIFMSYRDKEKIVEKIARNYNNKEPIINVNIDGIKYQIWCLINNNEINSIKEMMKDKRLLLLMDIIDIKQHINMHKIILKNMEPIK